MKHVFVVFLVFAGSIASAQTHDAGSLSGTPALADFGPAAMARGAFTLPTSMQAPQDRGPLLAPIFPFYSPENGLSEWGMGWANALVITRTGRLGGAPTDFCFCDNDQFNSPWGRLVPNAAVNGTFYPSALLPQVRVVHSGTIMVATLPDGSVWTFGGPNQVNVSGGTYAWYLTSVVDTAGHQTALSYTANPSGRLFLTTVNYGADFQYLIQIAYTSSGIVAQKSYISGVERDLDRLVDHITFEASHYCWHP